MISPQNDRIFDKSPFLLITPGGQHLYIKGKLTARNLFVFECRSQALLRSAVHASLFFMRSESVLFFIRSLRALFFLRSEFIRRFLNSLRTWC